MESNSTTTQTVSKTNDVVPMNNPSMFGSIAPLLLMLVAFYFLLMRPQQKKEAKRRDIVNAAKKDDKVLTSSGIIGKIHKIINDKEMSLEISEGVRIRILKTAIVDVLKNRTDIEENDVSKTAAETSPKKDSKGKNESKKMTKSVDGKKVPVKNK